MPFGLKNAGATYQRAITQIFDELIHNQVECYVDDLVVKSKEKEDHLFDFRIVFERLRQSHLQMNPFKLVLLRENFEDLSLDTAGLRLIPRRFKLS